jgi:hypothetical protein
MPFCERCGSELAPRTLCPLCGAAHEGEDFFISELKAAGVLLDDDQAEFARLAVAALDLDTILKDRAAREQLLSLARDRGVLEALKMYAERCLPRNKRGPKPDPKTGKYKYEVALALQQKGDTSGQAARKMYPKDPKASRVSALLSKAKKSRSQTRPI